MKLTRRGLLQAGGALCVAFGSQGAQTDRGARGELFTGYVRVDSSGQITVVVGYVEMGQGTYTAIPMLIAEELEVPLASVRVEHAPPDERRFGNPLLGGIQVTGNSNAIRGTWESMRRAGAVGRVMLVRAAARRWKVDAATCRAENGTVVHAGGRRLRYGELTALAARLAPPDADSVTLKRREDFRLIGTPARRLDLAGKVDGSARYGIDARVPGMKFASLVISPAFGGSLRALDESVAKALPGVRQIVRLDDAVAVVADHQWAAKRGAAALRIDWHGGPHGNVDTASIVEQMRQASAGTGVRVRQEGDFDAALAAAAARLDATYEIPFLAHATMEPMNCTVHVRKNDCEVWVGTQVLGRAREAVAKVTHLPVERVTVHNHLLGGGFGRRLEVDGIVRAAQVAMHVEGPVQLVYSREDDIQHDMYRPYFLDQLSAGLDARGMPVAWRHRITGSSIMGRWFPPVFQNGFDPETVDGAVDPPYTLPNLRVEYVRHEPPGIPTAFWRGVGPTHNVFMVESFLDELAKLARQDPVAYRRALLHGNARARRVLDLAAEMSQWGRRLPQGSGRGIAIHQAFGSHLAMVAEIAQAGGAVRVRRVVCAIDCGVVVNPDIVRAQMEGGIVFGLSAALHGRITLKNGRVEQRNFGDYRVLRLHEMPEVDVHIVAGDHPPGGVGETATACIMPAVANAWFAATGRRVRQLPLDQVR